MTKSEKLAIELFDIGVAARRKFDGFSDGRTRQEIWRQNPGQQAAWLAIGEYVVQHFERKKKAK